MPILDHFPAGLTPRPQQAEILTGLEQDWDRYDVFVVSAPTGVGKTEIAVTLGNWLAADRGLRSNILEPTNQLVAQIQARYPQLAALHKQDAYRCEAMAMSCHTMKQRKIGRCQDCVYRGAKQHAKDAAVRLMNYHTYASHRMFAPVAIFDEAHQIIDMLQDRQEIKLWQWACKFPENLQTVADVVVWLQGAIKAGGADKLKRALYEIKRIQDGATIEYRQEMFRGHSEAMLCIKPASTRMAPPWLWPPGKVRKVVLMSATIAAVDVAEMGLATRRVRYLSCDSPIPPERRPVVYRPACNMAARYSDTALELLAARITEVLAAEPGRGLIHLPYRLAEPLGALISSPRLMFHDRDNKQEMLDLFRSSPVEEGRVLVASGMYEGIDLPYDAARWQVIGKVPFLSLGDEFVKQKTEQNPDWYAWEAIKRVLQATGRISRAADDFGRTYVFDTQFGRLLEQDMRRPVRMFPDYYRRAIQLVR